jgi:predicted nucleotidyltransferase
MHATITTHRDEITALCDVLGVRRLDVFGSATTHDFDELASDIDLLVEFSDPTSPSYADGYFTLKDELERILERPVDLVTRLSIRNPYFLRRVEATMENLYAA